MLRHLRRVSIHDDRIEFQASGASAGTFAGLQKESLRSCQDMSLW